MTTETDSACFYPTKTYSIPLSLPQHVDYGSRLTTFKDLWPRYLPGPSIEDLARSGFVYLGTGDRVKCFCCGIICKDWEPADCAYDEHYRWASRCPYIRIIASNAVCRL